MSLLVSNSTAAAAAAASMHERRIEMSWTQMTKELCDGISRTILDRDVDVPLRVVSLIDNHLGAARARQIASCLESSPVREIRMRYNDIGREGSDALADVVNVSSKLELLDVRGNHLQAADARKLLRALGLSTSLTHFCVAGNKLGPDGAALLAKALDKNTYLTYLDVSTNELGPVGGECIARVLATPASTLRRVELHGNYLGAAGVQHICRALCTNTQLRSLTLGNNHATDEAAAELAAMLAANHTLESLDVRLNSFTAAAVQTMARQGLKHNVTLTSLILAGNAITALGVDELTRTLLSHQRSALTRLDLSSCSLGGGGGSRVAQLIGASITLREVNLSDNNLDDDAACALARNIADGITITVLDLSCNAITEVGAAELIDATLLNAQLSSLILHGNRISRVLQKKMDTLLDERLARNRVESAQTALQHQQRMLRDVAAPATTTTTTSSSSSSSNKHTASAPLTASSGV